jgi:uncharacterized protein YqgC (DUF456 family)
LGGAVIHAVATDFNPIGWGQLALLAALAAIAYSLDYLSGALGVKKLGGSRWAMLGAVLGAIVGVFFGFVGLILGPIIGSVVTEWVRSRKLNTSLRSGAGTVLGMVLGMVAKLTLSVIMASLIFWWIWQG